MTLRSTITPVIRHTQHYLSLSLSVDLSLTLSLCVRFCVFLNSICIYFLLFMWTDMIETNVVENNKKGLKHSNQRSAWRAYVRNLCTFHLNSNGLFLFLDLFLSLTLALIFLQLLLLFFVYNWFFLCVCSRSSQSKNK